MSVVVDQQQGHAHDRVPLLNAGRNTRVHRGWRRTHQAVRRSGLDRSHGRRYRGMCSRGSAASTLRIMFIRDNTTNRRTTCFLCFQYIYLYTRRMVPPTVSKIAS